MSDTQIADLESLDDLLALAAVLEDLAAERYDLLALAMREQGNFEVASLLEALAQEERGGEREDHSLVVSSFSFLIRYGGVTTPE